MPAVTVDGREIFYRESGAGPTTLVCLHGISSNSRSWRGQLEGLAGSYRVIVWDAPGYGQSDDPPEALPMEWYAGQLAAFMDALRVPKAVIVGLSLGGVLAQEFYRHFPGRFEAIILADTNTGGGARPPAERQARLQARLKALEELSLEEMARQRAPNLLSPGAPPELLAEVQAMMREIHPTGYRYMAMAQDAADEREVLPAMGVPALVLWGEHDRVTPREEAEVIRAGIPGAKFEIIAGAGHLSNLEQSAAFNLALTGFLDEVL